METKTRTVHKAYLITGGTKQARREKYLELVQRESLCMHSDYEGTDELAVVFSTKPEDFKGLKFEEAKKLAGNALLGSEFNNTYTYCYLFGGEVRNFGVINLPAPAPTFTSRL